MFIVQKRKNKLSIIIIIIIILGWFHCATRMHFSRMHTACCSGHPSAAPHHTCPPTMHASLPCMPHLLPYMPSVMHASLPCMPPRHACPRACPLQCMSPATHPPTMHAPHHPCHPCHPCPCHPHPLQWTDRHLRLRADTMAMISSHNWLHG